jgi:hypothetical protein
MVCRKKTVIIRSCLVIFIILAGLISFDIFVLGPGPGLYRYNMDIDLNSGVLRKRFFYWIVPVKHEIVSTDFSKMISDYIEKSEESIWEKDIQTVTISGAKLRKGGRAIASCNALANAIFVVEAFEKLSKKQKIEYLNKGLDFLEKGQPNDIYKLAEYITLKHDFFEVN